MASRASKPRKDFAAARAFFLTLFVISAFAAWRFVIPGDPLRKVGENGRLQKRGGLAPGEVLFSSSDEEVGTFYE